MKRTTNWHLHALLRSNKRGEAKQYQKTFEGIVVLLSFDVRGIQVPDIVGYDEGSGDRSHWVDI